ncbi:MurR/RpiR family transcriptional regulator [Enterococcus sp. ALS3]|uniref:MurR/RpiR family transcriptional regulator n=1 Tax=Enterococcus alishanensis TaxID=1303817 RepID=A0ABS6TFE6_9ENTE|nr:MurR/RpiR family transcriptional regulator [Enterococcus alishanensis]MBV7391666.1 MurR/RpiR family transcriptional regulator [Enterococcus alishanensis]
MAKDIRQVINSFSQDLSPTEKKIADYLLDQRDSAAQLTIKELSQTIQVSTATLSRFAKRLGYQSFQELKIALNIPSETNADEFFSDLNQNDDLLTLAQKVFAANIASLKDTANFLDETTLETAINLLTKANKTGFFGIGGSQIIALDAYHKFMRTNLEAECQSDYHLQLMLATKLTKEDCAVVISHTGRNQEILRLCEILQENQVPIICLTSYAGSPLAKVSEVALIALAEETAYRSEAMSAIQSQFTLIDTLFMLYSVSNGAENNLARKRIRQTIKKTRI